MEFFRTVKLDGQKAAIADKHRQGDHEPAAVPRTTSASTTCRSTARRDALGRRSAAHPARSQIGSGLTGVMYVLDEPSIGLHQRDNDRLLATLKHLRDLGNSVIVVEHDEDAIASADYVVDMGPGAGEHGGQVVAQGTPEDIRRATAFAHGQYLAGTRQIPIPAKRNRAEAGRELTITGAAGNNLRASPCTCRSAFSCASPACRARASRRSSTTRCTTRSRAICTTARGAGAVHGDRGARALRQGDQRRPEPHRAHAALQSRRPTPDCSRRSARSSRR
jgi:hypothetical protein